jgi:hypothetical protein
MLPVPTPATAVPPMRAATPSKIAIAAAMNQTSCSGPLSDTGEALVSFPTARAASTPPTSAEPARFHTDP